MSKTDIDSEIDEEAEQTSMLAIYYLANLEEKDLPVADATFKIIKEETIQATFIKSVEDNGEYQQTLEDIRDWITEEAIFHSKAGDKYGFAAQRLGPPTDDLPQDEPMTVKFIYYLTPQQFPS